MNKLVTLRYTGSEPVRVTVAGGAVRELAPGGTFELERELADEAIASNANLERARVKATPAAPAEEGATDA